MEAHFGRPQDIEWCLAGGVFHVVQSRPITTLFPVPEVPGRRVYISVGHQQMMTDAMRPLGISLWQLSAARTMFEAGSRLFVDVTEALTRAGGRAGLMAMPGRSDPLLGDALRTLFGRDDLLPPMVDTVAETPAIAGYAAAPIAADPALVAELVALGDSAEPSEVTWLMVEPGAVPWHARWAALRSALGPNVPVASGTGSATIFLPDLHVQVAASNLRHGAFEQVSLRHPVARRAEVRALFTDALSVAGMRLVRSRRRMRTR